MLLDLFLLLFSHDIHLINPSPPPPLQLPTPNLTPTPIPHPIPNPMALSPRSPANSVPRTASSSYPDAAFVPPISQAALTITENQTSDGSEKTLLPVLPADLPSSLPLSLGPFVERGRDGLSDVRSRHLSWSSDADRDPDQPSPLARVRGCDVYIGFGGGSRPVLGLLVSWLRAELELQGVLCYALDRRRCTDALSHTVARAAMDMATIGVVVVTARSFANPYSVEELRVFLQRKKLVPIFFGLSKGDCIARDIIHKRGELWGRFGGELWKVYGGVERDWREVVDGLSHMEPSLEVNVGNLRDRVLDAVDLLGLRLGRRSLMESIKNWRASAESEFPYPRNANFVGRKKELFDLEILLLGDAEAQQRQPQSIRTRNRLIDELQGKSRGKQPLVWKEQEAEMDEQMSNVSDSSYAKGVACVCGDSGMGKTELLLEFAYRHSQRYKKVLWVGGEARYLRENYLKLSHQLGINIGNELLHDVNGMRSFKDIEGEAIGKIQKELMRDIPFLLVIDNLESEKDWWDGRSIMELLPRSGGGTHVIISTRLRQITNIKSLRLPYLSSREAVSLMQGSGNLGTDDMDVLRAIEEKIGSLPLGLALVGAILSELAIDPLKLLDAINKAPYREMTWSSKEDLVLKHNPNLVQLLDACFSLLDHTKNLKTLAIRMVEASSCFAPTQIPISMLAHAACGISEERQYMQFWKRLLRMLSCSCTATSSTNDSEAEALSMLIRLGIARSSSKTGYISFHGIFKLYAGKTGDGQVASSVVQAISAEGGLRQHSDHIWAACLLLFKFQADTVVVELSTHDLLSFVKRFVLPLASYIFTTYSMCNSVLELLRLSSDAIQELEDRYISEPNGSHHRPSSSKKSTKSRPSVESDPLLYQDLALIRAALLKMRARLMMKGGEYDIAEQLCTTAISIKEVLHGPEHPETQAVQAVMDQVVKLQSKFSHF